MIKTIKTAKLFLLPALLIAAAPAFADDTPPPPETKVSLEACEKTVLDKYPGKVVKVELKREKGVHVFEFDIQGAEKTWDIECSGSTGKIVEVEEEVADAEAPAFKAKAKISLDDAKKIALKKYPGEVTEIEYEIESDGAASYELDIVGNDGKETKVEVDATSGNIVEANPELWQRGAE
jgi:uncharacterized membrane protein YkoI